MVGQKVYKFFAQLQQRSGRIGMMPSASASFVIATPLRGISQTNRRKYGPTTTSPMAKTELELLPVERSFLTSIPSLTTLTVFRGRIASARPVLEERVRAVLAANPWVGSELKEGRFRSVCAYHSDSTPPLKRHFSTRYDLQVPRGAGFSQLMQLLAPARCPPASESLNSGAPHWRVTLVPLGPEVFGVVVSGAHALLDARGHYALQSMVLGGNDTRTLLATRNQRAMKKTRFNEPPSLLWPLLTKSYTFVYGNGTASPVAAFEVSLDWIRSRRKEARKKGTLVSTNDVLLAEFGQCDGGNAFDGFSVPLDLRLRAFGRERGLEPGDVGNYLDTVNLSPTQLATPELVRKAVEAWRPGSMQRETNNSRGRHVGIVSNWSLFSTPFKLPATEPILHLPLIPNPSWRNLTLLIVFRPAPGRLAITVQGPQDKVDAVRASKMISGELDLKV